MNGIFEVLMEEVYKNNSYSDDEQNLSCAVEKNKQSLKKHLTKKEKKLLLRLIDSEGLLREYIAVSNFRNGFKLGMKLGLEINEE